MLRILPLDRDAQPVLAEVSFLLDTMARWGALGAKSQNGFGQVELQGLDAAMIAEGRDQVKRKAAAKQAQPDDGRHFRLNHFFSHLYRLQEGNPYEGRLIGERPPRFDYRQHFIPCAFDIRYKSKPDVGMRSWFKARYGADATNQLLGESRPCTADDRSASRICVSHLYRREPSGPFHLKIWGCVPPSLRVEGVAEEVDGFVKDMFHHIKRVDEYRREEVLGDGR